MADTPRILIADKCAPACAQVFVDAGFDVETRTGLSPDELHAIIGEYDGLVVRSSTRAHDDAFWSNARRLKVIGRAGSGVDNIDLSKATQHGTLVMNTPGGNSISAAEHAIALMFAISRHVPAADASMKAGRWDKSKFKGAELTGKTLGIIGLGRIGLEAAVRGVGLQMNVVAFDPGRPADDPTLPAGVTLVSLDELVASADYISVHAPLNAHTRGLLNRDRLAQCKPGVRIVHAARGGIVVEADLLAALESGHVAAAGLDVFEEEPTAADNPLVRHPAVVATPHLGASTVEAQVRVAVQIAEQIVGYLRDGEVVHGVNQPA